jgi:hypothetical protein
MPCACLLPPEIYPDASEWGPLLWSIIHGLAERVGSSVTDRYIPDERRTLEKLFKALEKTIPCPSCKEHYEVYLKEHPVEKPIKELPYGAPLKEYVKHWYWELHNWVNVSLSRPELPYEALTDLYKGVNIRQKLKALDNPMKRAINLRSGQLFAYMEFLKQVNTLLSLYGI